MGLQDGKALGCIPHELRSFAAGQYIVPRTAVQDIIPRPSTEGIIAFVALNVVTAAFALNPVILFESLDFLCLCSADKKIRQRVAGQADAVQEARLLADLEPNPIVIVLEVLDGDRPRLALDAD